MRSAAHALRIARAIGIAAIGLGCLSTRAAAPSQSDEITTVYFPSADGKTELVGYLFEPSGPGRHPAVVLLHGRAGPYSSNVHDACGPVRKGIASPCDASTLSLRHLQWARYWTGNGHAALIVDSFGPRGKARGFERHTHGDADRADVDESTVRPLDAEGALAYLAARPSVRADLIDVQGWSNGASTVLNVMERQAARGSGAASDAASEGTSSAAPRFRRALAFYPGCGPAALISQRFETRAPVLVLLASNDEEVSPRTCRTIMDASIAAGASVEVVTYDGATHDFDDPGTRRQSVAANREARRDALARATAFFAP